jgi:hypothetical protein
MGRHDPMHMLCQSSVTIVHLGDFGQHISFADFALAGRLGMRLAFSGKLAHRSTFLGTESVVAGGAHRILDTQTGVSLDSKANA